MPGYMARQAEFFYRGETVLQLAASFKSKLKVNPRRSVEPSYCPRKKEKRERSIFYSSSFGFLFYVTIISRMNE